MDGISVAESSRARKTPKVLHHLEIHPAMGLGHRVEAHHTSYEHQVEPKEFKGPHDAVRLPQGHILHHIAKHMGIPTQIEEQGGSEPEPFE